MYIISSIAFVILWLLIRNRKHRRIPKFFHWLIVPFVLLVATTAFALSDVGRWLGGVIAVVIGFPVSVFGGPGAIMVTIAAALLLIATVLDIAVDQKPDGWAHTGLVFLPMLGLAASGIVGQMLTKMVHTVGQLGPHAVAVIVG